MPALVTPAITRLTQARVVHTVREYESPERHGRAREERPDYGLEAAAALRVEPTRMGKTLIVSVDGTLVAAVVPVDRTLDLKALATTVGGRRAELAHPAAAERATGFVVGGISPIGLRRRLPVVIDATLMGYDTILVSAGRRGLQLELAPADLVTVTDAVVGTIGRDPQVG